MSLAGTRLYLVAGSRLSAGRLAELVPDLAGAGVDMVQLREKEMEAGDVIRQAQPILEACRAAGIPFIVNDRADVAVAVGADGVHVGQNDVPVDVARSIVGDRLVGMSSHSRGEIDAIWSMGEPPDYFAVGPVYETPTKPGRRPVGLELIRYAASGQAAVPWFAIGGIDSDSIDDVIEAGARRVVVVRAITEAVDPVEAAAELKRKLEKVPL